MSEFTNYINKSLSKRMKEIIKIIEKRGFITDEDGFFGKIGMKKEDRLIINRIRDHCLFNLESTAHYYPGKGEFVAIYDSDVFKSRKDFLKRGLDPYVEAFDPV